MIVARQWTDNEGAALIAGIAGVFLLISGFTGASQWRRTFDLITGLLGDSPLIRVVGFGFIAFGSLGGIFVVFGAFSFKQNRVRTGRIMIWLGTGFTIATLILYVFLQVRHGEFPFAGAGVLGAAGIILSIIARYHATPIHHRR